MGNQGPLTYHDCDKRFFLMWKMKENQNYSESNSKGCNVAATSGTHARMTAPAPTPGNRAGSQGGSHIPRISHHLFFSLGIGRWTRGEGRLVEGNSSCYVIGSWKVFSGANECCHWHTWAYDRGHFDLYRTEPMTMYSNLRILHFAIKYKQKINGGTVRLYLFLWKKLQL